MCTLYKILHYITTHIEPSLAWILKKGSHKTFNQSYCTYYEYIPTIYSVLWSLNNLYNGHVDVCKWHSCIWLLHIHHYVVGLLYLFKQTSCYTVNCCIDIVINKHYFNVQIVFSSERGSVNVTDLEIKGHRFKSCKILLKVYVQIVAGAVVQW